MSSKRIQLVLGISLLAIWGTVGYRFLAGSSHASSGADARAVQPVDVASAAYTYKIRQLRPDLFVLPSETSSVPPHQVPVPVVEVPVQQQAAQQAQVGDLALAVAGLQYIGYIKPEAKVATGLFRQVGQLLRVSEGGHVGDARLRRLTPDAVVLTVGSYDTTLLRRRAPPMLGAAAAHLGSSTE